MLRKKSESVEWLEFELLADISELSHGVFLRHGGESQGPFASLNAGGGSGDDSQIITRNREMIRKIIGCNALVSDKQCHGVNIAEAPYSGEVACDGFVTQAKGLGLMIKHADCQAAIFYDPITGAVGNVHSGWRGNVQNIYAHAIDRMCEKYGCSPENLLVCISPSLGPCCGEFINYRVELPEEFWAYRVKELHFDLWEISRQQLLKKGVLPHHIEIASICTHCNPEDFFSYRREKATGRHATVVTRKC